jgi:hypothetical protein
MSEAALAADKSITDSFKSSQIRDKIGITASSLCAIHCLLTPFLLIFAKDFAGIWAHPAAHWILAAVTIPLALGVILKGGKQHGKKWVVACAFLGCIGIVGSLVAPMLNASATGPTASQQSASHGTGKAGVTKCTKKGCCPTVETKADGSLDINFPLATLLSIFGGLLLVSAHLGNLFYNRCHFKGEDSCAC